MPVGSVIQLMEKKICRVKIIADVPSEHKRGQDGLSDSERQYYIPNYNSFLRGEEQGLAPLFRIYGFRIINFVK